MASLGKDFTMRKLIFIASLAAFAVAVRGDDQPMGAVFLWDRMIPGVTGTLPFSEYGIKQFSYDVRTIDESLERNLAASRLFYVNSYDALNELLRKRPTAKRSIRTFLESGGTILFNRGPLYPPHLAPVRDFLKEIGVKHPGKYTHGLYRVAPDPQSEMPFVSEPETLSKGHPKAYGYWEKWDDSLRAPFRHEEKPGAAGMLVQENVLGAGRVIFNHVNFLLTLETGVYGQIFRNMMSYVYGRPIRAGAGDPIQTRFKTAKPYELWTKNPYDSLFNYEANAPAENATRRLDFKAAVNDHVANLLLITNGSTAPLTFKIDANVPGLRSDAVTVRELQFFKEHNGRWIYDPMPKTDAVTVPPGETRQLWIAIDTSGVKPGDYSGKLQLTTGDSIDSVALNVTVWPFELTRGNPLRFCAWDYAPARNRTALIGGWDNWKNYHQDLVDHGVNVTTIFSFNHPEPVLDADGNITEPLDFKLFDAEILPDRPEMIYLVMLPLNLSESRLLDEKPFAYLSPPWKRAFTTWLKRVVARLKEKGVDYDHFAMYPYDELHKSEDIPKALEIYKLIKEIDPKVKIFLTLGSRSKNSETFEKIKKMLPYVDICVPHINFHLLFSKGENFRDREIVKLLKDRGVETWSYWNCTERGADDGKVAHERCRLMPLCAYRLGIDGYGFWAYNVWKGNPWTAFDEDGEPKKKIGTEILAVVYSGPEPVPSIRWEAFRDGMNDVKYFEALKSEIAKSKNENAVAEAKIMLEQGPADVVDNFNDVTRIRQWRANIAEMIARLRGADAAAPSE